MKDDVMEENEELTLVVDRKFEPIIYFGMEEGKMIAVVEDRKPSLDELKAIINYCKAELEA